jgi:hypothetical protein
MKETEPALQSINGQLARLSPSQRTVKNWWTHLRVIKPPVKVVKCYTVM